MGIDLTALPGGFSAYVNSSSQLAPTTTYLDSDPSSQLSLPQSDFPFNRLALAFVSNSTEVYFYHQLDDSVFDEKY